MRRKTFDVLFETRDGMRFLVQERCMWRSLWYFALSVGLFSGVVTNQLFLDQALSVRFAVIAAAVSIPGRPSFVPSKATGVMTRNGKVV